MNGVTLTSRAQRTWPSTATSSPGCRRCLERMAALCGDRLILADEYSRRLAALPFLTVAEFRGETPWSTWWRPAPRAWRAMVRCAGFEDVREHGRFLLRFRGKRKGVPHVVLHARGPDR